MRTSILLLLLTVGCQSPGTGGSSKPTAAPHVDTGSVPTPTDTDDTDDTDPVEVIEGRSSPTLWERDAVESPGSATFTELHPFPASDDDTEWVELHNPMVLDLDVSGWTLAGAVDWTFPEGTRIPAGGFLVVAADPSRLDVDALGTWEGRLANEGERIELVSRSGRVIDTLEYGTTPVWTVMADGSGFTLAKRDHDAASDHAENWTASTVPGGTPGASNDLDPLAPPVTLTLVAEDAEWQVQASGTAPAADWTAPDFDDSTWQTLQAPLYGGSAEEGTEGVLWATADNYYAVYAGAADGSALRLLGEDSDGSWTTVDDWTVELTDSEHLFLAAWELTGDSTSTQMVIAELELPDHSFGTDATGWEWVLGAPGDNPGALPAGTPPDLTTVASLVANADALGTWAAPAVERNRTDSPWGGTVGSGFTDVAHFIWADTFDAASITNTDDTFALFRSIDPAVPPRGADALDAVPTTVYLRTPFHFDADPTATTPTATTLWLDCTVDDGLAVFVNGTEVHRENLPSGTLTDTTLANSTADPARSFVVEVDASVLQNGDNLLSVEVHQATLATDEDFRFGCALTAEVSEAASVPPLRLNEVPGADELDWVELVNVSGLDRDLGDYVLATSTGVVSDPLSGTVAAGGVAEVPVDLELDVDDRLFLRRADGSQLLDGVAVTRSLQARLAPDGPWGSPTEASPGDENPFSLHEDIIINEVMYHRSPVSEPDQPFAERDEEWLELYNRGTEPVDLGGWVLVDAVSYRIPEDTILQPNAYLVVAKDAAALRADWPGIDVVGDWEGSLANAGDRIVLLDARGNPADEVRYYDGGRWPKAPDGGGSSLELRSPFADNASAEAWAASDESGRSSWTDVSIRGPADPSVVGPDGVWNELVLGLLDEGVVLVDDLRVVRDPDGEAVDLLEAGSYDDNTEGWRLLGTHRHSTVVPDPDDAGNPVLRLVATGPTGHMHNHAETTLTGPTGEGEVEVSFRARWMSGSNQLHSRLYFHRLPTTTLLPQPNHSGTPGAQNSTWEANLGPTWEDLSHTPAVPRPGVSVEVAVDLHDPDGIANVTLWSAVAGAAFAATPMTEATPGHFTAQLPGQAAGTLVHFYVEATDSAGSSAFAPADGPAARALFVVQDGAGSTTGLHDLRILLTPADTDLLHEETRLMSNDLVGATVVYNDREVFYDVGVRLKGSQRGRPTAARVGYGIRFQDNHPFRGSHTSVMIDRSEGVGYGQRELLLNLAMTRAGSVSGEHNDLIQLIAPKSAYTGPAELQLDRFSNLVLDAQFDNGSDGTRFEYELVYYPTSTDDGTPEGYKRPQPDRVVGSPITWLGDDPEHWRWIFLIKNNARRDDYTGMQALGALFDSSDADFQANADSVIDVNQWLRAFAMSSMAGVTDQYGGVGSQHNAQFYVRPEDGRVLFFPHDLDFYSSSTMGVIGNSDLARLLENPAWERIFYAHLVDLVRTAYTTDHLGPWCSQLQALIPTQSFDAHCAFMDARAAHVRSGDSNSITARFPEVPFAITTNDGADFTVSGATVTLEGTGWVDVSRIYANADPIESTVTWLDRQTWAVELPLDVGSNPIELVATDLWGTVLASDQITVTRE
jgi:hypothetical protein